MNTAPQTLTTLSAILHALGAGLAALMILVSAPAHAAGGGGDEDKPSEGGASNRFLAGFTLENGDEDEEDDGHPGELDADHPRVVEMPAMVVPLVSQNRLQGYAFVRVRIRIAEGSSVWEIRENQHRALHVLVQASHRHTLSLDDGSAVNHVHAAEVLRDALNEYYGSERVDAVSVYGNDRSLILG